MQIFQLKLIFSKDDKYIKKNFYYSILGAVLGLFENDEKVYNSILKISYSFDKTHLFVFISIYWKDNFNLVVSKLLDIKNKAIIIDTYKFLLEQIDFNLHILDFSNLNLYPIDELNLKFLSPTQVRNQNKIFVLPESDRFLFSVYQKIKRLGFDFWVDEKLFKKWLAYGVIVKEFNIKTELVEIKKAKRAGVVGYISYIVYEKNDDYQKILYLIQQTIPYTWIWSGTRLGLWNTLAY